jgi:hypothetical protein
MSLYGAILYLINHKTKQTTYVSPFYRSIYNRDSNLLPNGKYANLTNDIFLRLNLLQRILNGKRFRIISQIRFTITSAQVQFVHETYPKVPK